MGAHPGPGKETSVPDFQTMEIPENRIMQHTQFQLFSPNRHLIVQKRETHSREEGNLNMWFGTNPVPPGTDLLGISSLNSSLSVTIYETEADDRYDDRFATTTLGAVCFTRYGNTWLPTNTSAGLASPLKCPWLHRKI